MTAHLCARRPRAHGGPLSHPVFSAVRRRRHARPPKCCGNAWETMELKCSWLAWPLPCKPERATRNQSLRSPPNSYRPPKYRYWVSLPRKNLPHHPDRKYPRRAQRPRHKAPQAPQGVLPQRVSQQASRKEKPPSQKEARKLRPAGRAGNRAVPKEPQTRERRSRLR